MAGIQNKAESKITEVSTIIDIEDITSTENK